MGLRDIFRTREQKLLEAVNKERRAEEEEQRGVEAEAIEEALAKVRFFSESKEEYERHVGYEVRIIDTGDRNMGVIFQVEHYGAKEDKCVAPFQRKKALVEAGIEAIVKCSYSLASGGQAAWYDRYYGLPVARKKDNKEPHQG